MAYKDVELAIACKLPAMQKIVLIILASHKNSKTGACHPSMSTIAEEAGMTERSVRTQISELKESGFIEIENTFQKGLKSSNKYRLNLANLDRKEIPNDRKEIPSTIGTSFLPDRNVLPINQEVLTRKVLTSKLLTRNKEEGLAVLKNPVLEIFDHWKKVMLHERANIDDTREKVIKSALEIGYTTEELKMAIDGCRNTPFYMGANDRGIKYDGLSVIFKNADNIDKFISSAQKSPDTTANGQGFSDQPRRKLDVIR